MTTIKELKESAERTQLTFNEINSATTDFTGFNFLSNPYCTLLKKVNDFIFIISFDCDDTANVYFLDNGTYKVEIEDNYVYDVTALKGNQVI